MRLLWTEEAVDDLAEILAYYAAKVSPRTAAAVERRIIAQVEGLLPFPERIRQSDRIPQARELVVKGLPYVVFLKLTPDAIVVLNVVHGARMFPP